MILIIRVFNLIYWTKFHSFLHFSRKKFEQTFFVSNTGKHHIFLFCFFYSFIHLQKQNKINVHLYLWYILLPLLRHSNIDDNKMIKKRRILYFSNHSSCFWCDNIFYSKISGKNCFVTFYCHKQILPSISNVKRKIFLLFISLIDVMKLNV